MIITRLPSLSEAAGGMMTVDKATEILNEIIDEGWLISDFDKCVAIDACEMAIEALKHFKTAHYINKDGFMWECSNCGAKTRIMEKYNIPNYCPCCGAKIVEEQQGENT